MNADLLDHFSQLPFEVHTTDFVFDELVDQNVITAGLAADKLELILLMRSRLPKKECDQRLQLWRNS
jgi:hypothetical protein